MSRQQGASSQSFVSVAQHLLSRQITKHPSETSKAAPEVRFTLWLFLETRKLEPIHRLTQNVN
ncbi:MAG: hypothetical protein ABI614_18275 [Planctomycetota bacterium]